LRDDSGATAIEYGLIAAGISVAIPLAVNTAGTTLNATFSNDKDSVANAGQVKTDSLLAHTLSELRLTLLMRDRFRTHL
jgi:pilus assembly protein Flp/PilA